MIKLRHWQQSALIKAIKWLLVDRTDRHFLINAAPGAGKTIAACTIAKEMIDRDEIDRVVVIAPRNEVVNQWSDDFKVITDRFMGKVTARDGVLVLWVWMCVQHGRLSVACRMPYRLFVKHLVYLLYVMSIITLP